MSAHRAKKKHKPASPFGWRWVAGKDTAVLLEQCPWGGSESVKLHAACPTWWLSVDNRTPELEQFFLEAQMKRKAKPTEVSRGRVAEDADFQLQYPTLFDYLTATTFEGEGNELRQVSTLLIFGQDAVWKACLRDRAESVCLWVAAPSVLGTLEVLEGELAGPTAAWRLDRVAGHQEATRRPRGKSS